MSWSITLIGTPDKLVEKLERESDKLSGQSKIEYDAALGFICGLIQQNYEKDTPPILKIEAAGHGEASIRNQCAVSIQRVYGEFVG